MPKYVNARELRRQWDDPKVGPEKVKGRLTECLDLGRQGKPGGMRMEHFSIRDLFEELIPAGRDVLRAWQRGGGAILESVAAADTSAFSSIVGQLMYDRLLQGYENPAFIWPQLCQQIPTTQLFGQKVPGVANLGDVGEIVGEGKEYPLIGGSANYVEWGALNKRGFRVPLTRELTIADNTGLVIQRLDKTSESLGINLEKRVLDMVTGQTVANNNYSGYKRNGNATATYLTSGAYVNKITPNVLIDWTNIQAAELLFDALNDPDTGEPIIIGGRTLLVPSALLMTARRIVTATSVEHVDNQVAATTYRTMSSNPLSSGINQPAAINVVSSPYVKRRSTSTTQWWYGDFQKAFGRLTAWDIEKDQRGRESPLNFTNDIIMEFKGSVMDLAQVLEPRAVTQSN